MRTFLLVVAIATSIFWEISGEPSLELSNDCIADLKEFSVFPSNASLFYNATRVQDPQFNIRQPLLVALPTSVEQVQQTLQCASQAKFSVSVKGGGHSFGGFSSVTSSKNDRAIVLSFERMTGVEWIGESSVKVQAGARWGHVYQEFRRHGGIWVVTGGLCPSVGVVGFSLGGGVGPVARNYGLAADNVESVTMVTSDGKQVVHANAKENPELFWGLRGSGGGNFGVVVDLTFKVHAGPDLYSWGEICFENNQDQIHRALKKLGEASKNYSRLLNIDPVISGEGMCYWVIYQGPRNEILKLVDDLDLLNNKADDEDANAKHPSLFFTEFDCFWEMIVDFANHHGYAQYSDDSGFIKSCFVNDLSDSLASFIAVTAQSIPDYCSLHLIEFGGKIQEVPKDATAFYWRDSEFMMYISCGFGTFNSTEKASAKEFIEKWFSDAQPWCSGSYINFIDPYLQNWEEKYYGANLPRLSELQYQWNQLSTSPIQFDLSIPDQLQKKIK